MKVGLHPEVIVVVVVNVARTQEQADVQARTGAAVTRTGAESREEADQVLEEQSPAIFEADSEEQSIESLRAELEAQQRARS